MFLMLSGVTWTPARPQWNSGPAGKVPAGPDHVLGRTLDGVSTRSEPKILGNHRIPETSARSEEKILGHPRIPETSTGSEEKPLGSR